MEMKINYCYRQIFNTWINFIYRILSKIIQVQKHMIFLIQILKTESMTSEVRMVMAMVKEWVAVNEGTPREYFWVCVPFLEFGGGYMGMFIYGMSLPCMCFCIECIGVILAHKVIQVSSVCDSIKHHLHTASCAHPTKHSVFQSPFPHLCPPPPTPHPLSFWLSPHCCPCLCFFYIYKYMSIYMYCCLCLFYIYIKHLLSSSPPTPSPPTAVGLMQFSFCMLCFNKRLP